ncbi:MAG: hypothetical protein GQ574_27420 [Crocinitomix sp.]|nr:hypothetical protein [Crocinitomix sp.]
MQLNWNSLEALGDQSVDVWILVPTGLGVNRLLKNDGEISKPWLEKLESFLGMSQEDILSYFYKKETKLTLFGDQEVISKTEQAVERSAELYKKRLNDLFKYVSEPYVLRNKTNSIMFHFLMATNNNSAAKVATEIVSKYNKKN